MSSVRSPVFGLLAAILFAVSCGPSEIVIGFAGSLSGKDYALGYEGRNAAELFVSQVNAAGGIEGRPLRLVVVDEESDPGRVAPAVEELAAAGAVAIFGHFTSAFAELAIPRATELGVALVSPTATAMSLSGRADVFFRTVMSSAHDPLALAEHMRARGIRAALVIHTARNPAYVETYLPALASSLAVPRVVEYEDVASIDFDGLVAAGGFEAIVVIASALDTASIAQALAKRGVMRPLYVSGWAGNDDLVSNGGSAVEGALFVHQVDPAPGSAFAEDYRAAYGSEPGFAAYESWDAMLLVAAAIRAGGGDRPSFLRAIASVGSVEGLCGPIVMDAFGDARRDLFYRVVRGGRIVTEGKYR